MSTPTYSKHKLNELNADLRNGGKELEKHLPHGTGALFAEIKDLIISEVLTVEESLNLTRNAAHVLFDAQVRNYAGTRREKMKEILSTTSVGRRCWMEIGSATGEGNNYWNLKELLATDMLAIGQILNLNEASEKALTNFYVQAALKSRSQTASEVCRSTAENIKWLNEFAHYNESYGVQLYAKSLRGETIKRDIMGSPYF